VAGVGVIVALLVLALTFAPVAAARGHGNRPFASLPHLGPAPNRCELGTDPACPEFTSGTDFTVESSCGAINISPHIVNVGQNITATMVETARQCRIQWGTPPGKKVAGCKDGVYKEINPQDFQTITPPSSTCQWKATTASAYPPDAKAPGGGWDQFEVGFCAFVGCAALASDYFFVLPHKKAISGTVYSGATDANGFRLGLADAVIKLSGPSSGTAVTNKSGSYDALVDPGKYTVHVESVGGQPAKGTPLACSPGSTSGTDCKLDVAGHDGVADFSSCGSGCQLKVFVKIVGPIANVGTRSGLAIDNGLPNEGPVNFTIPVFSIAGSSISAPNEVGEKCMSGCANLLVTVIDPQTHMPAPGATVDSKLGQIDTQGAPALSQQGSQFLCTQSADPTARRCGTDLSGLTTDQDGKLRLIYWAPGEIVSAHTKIDVTASETCSPAPCSSGHQPGSATSKIAVKPYLIYKHKGELSSEEAGILREIVGDPALGDVFNGVAHKVLEVELHALVHAGLVAKAVLKAAEGPLGYALVELVDLAGVPGELKEQWALQEAFLEATGLREEGLDGPPFEKQVPARSVIFDQAILHGVAHPLHAAAGGLLWNLGKALNEKYKTKPKNQIPAQDVSVQAYEVSSCSERRPNCGPGYLDENGIVPRLCFFVSWSIGLDDTLCTPPYNPVVWMTTQNSTGNGLDTALP
jgi:hypothetical protein